MKDTVTIQRKDLQMLAEALKRAEKIIQGLEVREENPPKLSKKQRKINMHMRSLMTGKRIKKAEILKK